MVNKTDLIAIKKQSTFYHLTTDIVQNKIIRDKSLK
jgi:hypothetical protein